MYPSLISRCFCKKTRNLNAAVKINISSDSEQIVIPKRISRGPTDILRALAKTHKRDPTAAHYKYHDDPYLIPYSNATKRSYALSQEAGRKAAYWVRQEHADLFNHKVCDPPIEVFFPKISINEDSEVSIGDLKHAIDNVWVIDSITIYNKLASKGIELSNEEKQSFLELLSYYNEEDGTSEDWVEERWFCANSNLSSTLKKTWKDNGLAQKVFNSMKPQTAEAYDALISGMCKHGQLDQAMKYFEEAQREGHQLGVNTYNGLLSKVNFLRESQDLMWNLEEELLKKMSDQGLKPNVGTLNAVLETLDFMASHRKAKSLALQVIAEMKQFNVFPSLASYFHVLNIYYYDRSKSGILYDIVQQLEGLKLQVFDLKDCLFFVRAMEICRHKLHDINLAYRIHNLLHTDDNYNFIGDGMRESQYYRFFMLLVCEVEPLDKIMKTYEDLVPHVYVPEPTVFLELLNSVELFMGYQHLPRLWTDMVNFDYVERQNLLIKMLELLNQNTEESLNKLMVDIGWSIWLKIENQKRERNKLEWTGGMLSSLMTIFLKNGEKAKANLILDKMVRLGNNLTGEPDIASLKLYIQSCIDDKTPDLALKCIKFSKDIGFSETEEFAKMLESSMELAPKQLERLKSIVEFVDTNN